MEFKRLIPLLVIGAILVFGLIKIENLTEENARLESEYSYLVDKTFPVLKQDELPIAIGAVSYELILTEIEDHLVNFD